MIQEIRAYLSYRRIKKPIFYWRAKGYEVDLIIGNDIALEFKLGRHFKPEFTKGLVALKEEKLIKKHIVVGQFSGNGVSKNIDYINYKDFLKKLWNGEVV